MQLSQIGADLEEFTKISHYIVDLRNQVVKLQQNLDLCEETRSALDLKCCGLSDQNAYLEVRSKCSSPLCDNRMFVIALVIYS